jgi:hypothetical protein
MWVPFGIILLLLGIAVVIVGNRLRNCREGYEPTLPLFHPFSVEPVKRMPGITLMWFAIASLIT